MDAAALLTASRNLDFTPDLMLPGISVKTSGDSDPYPIEAIQVSQFSGEDFRLVGEVIQASSG